MDWKTWKRAEEWIPSKLQHCWERPEYWDESWRHKETWCYLKTRERPSVNGDVKNSYELIIITLQKTNNNLMYMDDINVKKKKKRIRNTNSDSENIQSGYRNVFWHRKMSMLQRKSKKWLKKKLNNQIINKIRTLKDEIYEYLKILDADTIEQLVMKQKI